MNILLLAIGAALVNNVILPLERNTVVAAVWRL